VLRLESELGEIDGKIRDLSAAKGGSFGEFHAHQQLRSVHEQVEVARRLREILIRRLADFHEAAAREYYFLSKQHENLERGF
jgi:hypothetical protein